jgi:hypothetical protein
METRLGAFAGRGVVGRDGAHRFTEFLVDAFAGGDDERTADSRRPGRDR